MSRFILIDHSLKDLGGHYYTYASSVLPAAERAGFQIVLATHRDFIDFDALPRTWSAHASFRQKSHSHRDFEGAPSGSGLLRPLHAWWARTRRAARSLERQSYARNFAEDCAALFERIGLQAGDHAFFATASELDVEGLALYLQTSGAHRGVHWHLQFHLGPFYGREPDYPSQTASREAMAAIFRDALARIPGHRLNFYCTTEQLTAQYEYLSVARFHTLPYPVHALYRDNPASRPVVAPARIACLGHNRREKGYQQLPILVRELWRDFLSTGRAQLVLQTRRRDQRRALDRLVDSLGPHGPTPPITYAGFPLALQEYAALVRSSDVGLLLYDSTRYYARCSGVLLEMLSAGVPVVAPAGSWLAEQIDAVNQAYLERVAAAAPLLCRVAPDELQWHGPAIDMQSQQVAFDIASATADCAVAAGSTSLLVRFGWLAPNTPGTYMQLRVQQFDAQGRKIDDFTRVAGARAASDQPIHLLFHLRPDATRLRLSCRNGWSSGNVTLGDFECLQLGGPHLPAGAVGLTAANIEQSAALLLDILQHLEHYRAAAATFAKECALHHSADQIVAQLAATAARNLGE